MNRWKLATLILIGLIITAIGIGSYVWFTRRVTIFYSQTSGAPRLVEELPGGVVEIQSIDTIVETPQVPVILPRGCELAQNAADRAINSSSDWTSQLAQLQANITVTGLPIFVRHNDIAYVGYKSNLVRVMNLQAKTGTLTEAAVAAHLTPELNSRFKQLEYQIVRQSSSQSEENKLPSRVVDMPQVNITYIYQQGNELFAVKAYNTFDSEKGFEDRVTVEYYCAGDISEESRQYAELLTTPNLFDTQDKYRVVTIWDVYDNAYRANIGSLAGFGGASNYIARINGQLVSLYASQDWPPCKIFEQHKVGRGLKCYGDDDQEREVTY